MTFLKYLWFIYTMHRSIQNTINSISRGIRWATIVNKQYARRRQKIYSGTLLKQFNVPKCYYDFICSNIPSSKCYFLNGMIPLETLNPYLCWYRFRSKSLQTNFGTNFDMNIYIIISNLPWIIVTSWIIIHNMIISR